MKRKNKKLMYFRTTPQRKGFVVRFAAISTQNHDFKNTFVMQILEEQLHLALPEIPDVQSQFGRQLLRQTSSKMYEY